MLVFRHQVEVVEAMPDWKRDLSDETEEATGFRTSTKVREPLWLKHPRKVLDNNRSGMVTPGRGVGNTWTLDPVHVVPYQKPTPELSEEAPRTAPYTDPYTGPYTDP